MRNRSVTVEAKFANEVANALGGVINGSTWVNPVSKQNLVLVTVLNREETLKNTKEFKKLKREGKIISWAQA